MFKNQHSARVSRVIRVVVLALAGSAGSLRAQSWGQNGVNVFIPPNQFFFGSLGVNNSGQVAGGVVSGSSSAAFFTPNIGVTTVTMPPTGVASVSRAINNAGQLAGDANFAGSERAVFWNGGSPQNLGTLGGASSIAFGMNDLGQVVGYSYASANPIAHAFLWSGSGLLDLGTLGGTSSNAQSVNNSGQVVGFSSTPVSGESHAFLWTSAGSMQDLGTLGGTLSSAYSVNSRGQVIGWSTLAGNVASHGFFWSGGVMQDLGTLGGTQSQAWDVSDAGSIVGGASNAGNVFSAAIWESSGGGYQAYDLATIVNDGVINNGWLFSDARGISDDGQWITALGRNSLTGYNGMVVLQATVPVTATPEPASLTLMATGMVGMAGLARRRAPRRIGATMRRDA